MYLIYLYLPLAILFAMSLNPNSWISLIQASALWSACFNSALLSLTATLISTSLTLSWSYATLLIPSLRQLWVLFLLPFLIPELLIGVAVFTTCNQFHIPLGNTTLVLIYTLLGSGMMIPLLHSQKENESLHAAAADLGATPYQRWITLTIPLLKPALYAATLFVFATCFDDLVFATFCGGGKQTLSLYLLTQMRLGESNHLAAFASLLILIIIAFHWR